ncbi:hypothetical protein ['Camptotheca acuminata' phytoplasma]|uniref:hypothetical protein n=1 Tax='Camptotheca acuminata' phytoplasma TaxID=3239192 RepID=UPI00351A256C
MPAPPPQHVLILGTSFTREVMEVYLPRKFNLPKFDLYDGTTDPEEQLTRFHHTMALLEKSDALMCRCFITSLEGVALKWFHSLPRNSIANFEELTARLIDRFITSRKLKQGHNESLKCYISRFSTELTTVKECGHRFTLATLTSGLHEGRFNDSLIMNQPSDMPTLLAEAQKYITIEDTKNS